MKENKENSTLTSALANVDLRKPCWYWDKKDLAHTPSQLEGLDPATEARYRREGARFIFDVGTRLGLHYDTLATGIIYFHRFYMFHSFKQFPRYVTGGCCLFLAGKVEETPKKCKDIIKTARSLLNDVQFSQFGDDPKEEVMVLERILLQTIKFDLQVEHPYQFLLKYAKQLKGDKNKLQKLVQMAWTFVNDSLCTMLCLQWEPEIIAVAVMYLAGRLCKFEIQEWSAKPIYRRWWEQFVQDVPVELLEDICHQILDLYSQGQQQMPQASQHQLAAIPSLEQPLPPIQVLQAKKHSPQSTPPRQIKRAAVASPKEDGKTLGEMPDDWRTANVVPLFKKGSREKPDQQPPKIPKLDNHHPALPPTNHPAPERKPSINTGATIIDSEPPSTGNSSEVAKAIIPPPLLPTAHQQPQMPQRPPPSAAYIMGMSTTSSYMSGEGFQSLQSMMKTDGPSYGSIPSYGPPAHVSYHPHVYPNPSVPPPTTYPPNIPPPTPGYPPPGYNPTFLPPPRIPPSHAVPPPPGLGLPPTSYPPPTVPPGGQPPGPPLPPPPGLPPVSGLTRGWLR
ncbi:cyclin-K isoform X2 [Amblyraja radiata]|uniref:cyclin-K isoform X2 n=1 Tax=Amblyraja radiata TaxID=386614 RepID=UPI0014038344|nr:cyclin-K isoform X2 [Amblyraja radiata]